jgi:hypothetical protein
MLPSAQALRNTAVSWPPTNSTGPALFIIDIQRGPILAPRGSKWREAQLRFFDHYDFSALWQGARSGVIKKLANVSYKINGPPAKVQYYQDILGNAHFGHGWEYLQKLTIRDFLTQGYGAIFEIAGPGDPDKPLLEAPTGLNHLDAGRCYVTGNPIYPLLYYSLWDGKLHKMHASRVYMLVDDPDPDERYFGIGTCALERAIAVNQREIRMGQYVDSLLDDKPQPGLLSLTGVSDNNWQALVANYLAQQQNDERPVFGRTLVLTSIDPNATVKAEVIPFAQTPEKFDFQKYTDLDVSALALALGIDRQELWELAGRGIGSGSQSAVLAMKSRAKLYGDVLTGNERFMNWAFLPEDCEFEYVEHDAQQDVTQTAIDLQLAQLAQTLAAIPGVSPLEIKKLLAARSDTFRDAMTDEMGRITVVSEDPKPAPQINAGEPSVSGDTPVDATPPSSAAPKLPSGQLVAQQTTKAFSVTSTDFRNHFASIVTRAVDKQIRRNQAENLLLGLLLSSGTKAFEDGLAQGGVMEMDEDDQAEVQDFVASSIDYLDPLLDSAFDGTLLLDQVEPRAEMWSNKSLQQMYDAGRISADKNGYYVWTLGRTEKHCPDCERLSGQIHRFKDYYSRGWIPKGDRLSCHGFRCDCRLDKTSGPGQGNF